MIRRHPSITHYKPSTNFGFSLGLLSNSKQPGVCGNFNSQAVVMFAVHGYPRVFPRASMRSDSTSPPNHFRREIPTIKTTLVKMCGISCARDAAFAADAGADYVGMIMSPNSKRSVSVRTAGDISRIARERGAEPVGVFVDDDSTTIRRASEAADLELVQLHGRSRDALMDLVKDCRIIYVLHATPDGILLNGISTEDCAVVDLVIIDSAAGGSGMRFDWSKLRVPPSPSRLGWLLAGGLNPMNVRDALSALQPDGLDVSSGICSSDGVRKDPSRITSFIQSVRNPWLAGPDPPP